MAIYSYYYGASIDRGINVQAQSRELESLAIRPALKDLASMHALKSSEHDGEMLSYMLSASGYHMLGVSYTESPKSSGYGRSAPCGIIHVASSEDMAPMADDLGRIVNFIHFQKPSSSVPAPLQSFPLNDSGYSFHNSGDVLSGLVDGLLNVVFAKPKQPTVLLVALPRGKSSEYAAARYAIAEALSCLPASLRLKVRFFTGLPVAENESDALVGFENAVRFGANVVFCPNEYYQRLKSQRTCIALDMEQPSGSVGAFAQFIGHAGDPSTALSQVSSCLSGAMSYDALNKATARVQNGEVRTIEQLTADRVQLLNERKQLATERDRALADRSQWQTECTRLTEKYNGLVQEYQQMAGAYNQLRQRGVAAAAQPVAPQGRRMQFANAAPAPVEEEEEEPRRSKARWALITLVVLLVLVFAGLIVFVFTDVLSTGKEGEVAPTPTEVVEAANPEENAEPMPAATESDIVPPDLATGDQRGESTQDPTPAPGDDLTPAPGEEDFSNDPAGSL